MLRLGTSTATWPGRADTRSTFEAPSSLVLRLDRELDAAMPFLGRSHKARNARLRRPEIMERASKVVTHGLSETARLLAHIALAGALGVMSARIVQLIAAMG